MPETPKNPLLISRKTTPNAQPGYQTDARTVENWASSLNAAQVKSAANTNSTTPQIFNAPVGSNRTGSQGTFVGQLTAIPTSGTWQTGDYGIGHKGRNIVWFFCIAGGTPGTWISGEITPGGASLLVACISSNNVTPVGFNNVALTPLATGVAGARTPPGPLAVASSALAYIVGSTGKLVKITIQNLTFSNVCTLSSSSTYLGVSPNGKYALVGRNSASCQVVDLTTGTPSGDISIGASGCEGIVMSPDSTKGYITGTGGAGAVITLASATNTHTLPVGNHIAISPNGTHVAISTTNRGTVALHSGSGGTPRTVTTMARCGFLCFSKTNGKVFVSTTLTIGSKPRLYTITVASASRITATTLNPGTTEAFGFITTTPARTRIWVVHGDKVAHYLLPLSGAVGPGVTVGSGPSDIVVTPTGRLAYVSCATSTTVTILTATNGQRGSSISVGHTPICLVLVP